MAYCGGGVSDEAQMDDDGVDTTFAVEFNLPIQCVSGGRGFQLQNSSTYVNMRSSSALVVV